MESTKLAAKTFLGLEDILAKELAQIGAENIKKGNRIVFFTGDKELMYRTNFELRTAIRILKPIITFKATTADEVYEKIKQLDWTQYLDVKTTFSVDSVVYSDDFRNSKFVSYKVKDAIVDFFREQTGQRPNISVAAPDIRFNMHISEDNCTLSLDSSGESLHKRGYRQATVESPINEVLAAAMILMTGWKGECDFIDPMCGSGTILIEAALIARNIAPGVFRQNYAFEKWPDFDRSLFEKIYNDDSKERPFEHHIYGYDSESEAIISARQNVKAAGLSSNISLAVQPIQQFTQPTEKSIIVMNPPYGERITTSNLLGLYKTIGERLKHQFAGNDAWIIGYRMETFDQIGLKPSLKIPLYNGSLNCEFRKYTIFNGQLQDFRARGGIVKTNEERARNAEKRRIKPRREFQRDAVTEDTDSEIPEYLIRRHREFVAKEKREIRRAMWAEKNAEREERNNRRSSDWKGYDRPFEKPRRPRYFDKEDDDRRPPKNKKFFDKKSRNGDFKKSKSFTKNTRQGKKN
ncbi:MAG: RNA methyltransferase [Bacteroidaceae bacterium]|nr:RNA methyltransferase [Bacteroidaceae bacterium]